jgi:hypothetical protein
VVAPWRRLDIAPVIEAYQRGDKAAAVDRFLRTVCGDGYRDILERTDPQAFDHAVDHVDVFFQIEMPNVRQWTFDDRDARSVRQPVLNVLGADSAPRFVEGAEIVQRWFPRAERSHSPVPDTC